MLEKYDVTPEMLLYRLSELIPQFFGLKLHFLRFQKTDDQYQLVKQLNMNNLLLPNGLNLQEHHCRRWLPLRLLRDMVESRSMEYTTAAPLIGAQISEFLESHERFLCFGFARPLALSPQLGSSVVIGFRLNPDLKQTIHFVEDPTLPIITINETCERCPLSKAQCLVRAAPPIILEKEKQKVERKIALDQLVAHLRS
jgi:hypothetical protein